MRLRYAIVDVDDVLAASEAALDAATAAMHAPLAAHLGRRGAAAVEQEFRRALAVGVRHLRAVADDEDAEYAALMRRTARWQRGLTAAGFEVKAWSRHALLACALEACRLPVSAALLEAATERYWATLADAGLYSDAAPFVRRLREAGLAVHLTTGSDGFLTFDDASQTFTYAPEDSRRRKLERLSALAALGFGPGDITTGDPIGKPSLQFYGTVLQRFAAACGQEIDLSRTLVVGDSLGNDILPLLEMGAARGVWLLRSGATTGQAAQTAALPARVSVVGSLADEAAWGAVSG